MILSNNFRGLQPEPARTANLLTWEKEKCRGRKANTSAVSQRGKLIGSISLVKMNEEIKSPDVSSESPPLAAGKLADDKLTVGILFLALT